MRGDETTIEGVLESTAGLKDVVARIEDPAVDIDGGGDAAGKAWPLLLDRANDVFARAFEDGDRALAFDFHTGLRRLLRFRTVAHRNRRELSWVVEALITAAASRWISREIREVAPDVSGLDAAGAEAWFDRTLAGHPAPDHALYSYLEADGDAEAFRYFVTQEYCVSSDFVDLLALTQVGLPPAWKQEVARNYWEEMGDGNAAGAHAKLFRDMQALLGVREPLRNPSLGALVCGNMFLVLSFYRSLHLSSIGALAATELAVPRRFTRLVTAAKRLGLPDGVVGYYDTHVEADESHGGEWVRAVVVPALRDDPGNAEDVAVGVHLRLRTSLQYCDELLANLRQGLAEPVV